MMACEPHMACCLFLYGLWTKDGYTYLNGWEKKKHAISWQLKIYIKFKF